MPYQQENSSAKKTVIDAEIVGLDRPLSTRMARDLNEVHDHIM